MTDPEDFFKNIYQYTSLDETAAHYAKFATAYDDAMAAGGYVTPGRCAEALDAAGANKAAPVLDIGCGSGLSGLALKAQGFAILDGTDYSEEMLTEARGKNLYRTLWQADLTQSDETRAESYDTINAAGVLNPAHAPAEALDNVMAFLRPGGLFAFSLNDHAVADGSYEGRIHMMLDGGWADLLHREYGEHMPAKDLKAWVYVLQKR
jgi:predicted TPR repeat methyltransferase